MVFRINFFKTIVINLQLDCIVLNSKQAKCHVTGVTMGVKTDIDRILKIKKEIYSAIIGRGVTSKDFPRSTYLEHYPQAISSIESGTIDDTNGVLIVSKRLPEPRSSFGGGIAATIYQLFPTTAQDIIEEDMSCNKILLTSYTCGAGKVFTSNIDLDTDLDITMYDTSSLPLPNSIDTPFDI